MISRCRTPSLLILVALLSGASQGLAATFFDTKGTPYATAYDTLASEGIVSGYSDGTGRPFAGLNRAEALKVVMSMRTEDKALAERMRSSLPPLPLFSDMDQTSWYASYVEAGFQRGIVRGYPDGTLRPGQLVAVEEAIALLLRAYGEQGTAGPARLSSSIENHDNQWYTPYLNAAIDRNLIMHLGVLRPGTAITRGQFFDIAYRLHEITAKKITVYAGEEPRVLSPVPSASLSQRPSGAVIHVPQPARVSSPYASEKYFAITMPNIGITDLAVIHPSDPFSQKGILEPLQIGVGHLFSFPGGGGKVMIYGHSSAYPWDRSQYTKIFRKINELKGGDRVYVTYDGKLHVYEVTHEQTIAASDTSAFHDNGLGEELILYTCWPPDSIAQRYLVHAVPVETMALR
jgi:LPXTG-site transpeptidase (sortase) family protein